MKIEAQTLAALLLLGTITACDNASTGGDTIIENPLVVDDPTGQDGDMGEDNAGDDAPDVEDNQDDPPPVLEGNVLREVTVDPDDEAALATVQAALDQALPGDKITIAAGVYHETAKIGDSETLKGLMVKVSGTAENPIIIEGELEGDTLATVIDQQKTTFDHEQPVVGIYLDCVQHVIIRNLRIQNVNQAGITSPLQGCPTEYLNIENVHINNVFGAEKTAGVRLLNAANVVVSKVVIDNVQSSAKLSQATEPQAMAMQADETQSEQNPFQSGSVTLENNTVSNVQQGIHLTAQGESVIDGVTINRNRITKAHDAITMEAVGEQAAKIVDVALRDNVINQVNRAVVVAANESVLVDDLSITNNTIVEASGEAALVLKGATGVQVYNNLFSAYQKAVSSYVTDSGSLNEFTYWDYNAYWEPEQPVQWTLAQGHPQYERFWANFKTWQDDELGSEEMRNAPDGNSHDDLDPAFQDNDYKLAADSPLRQAGRRGEAIGASRE